MNSVYTCINVQMYLCIYKTLGLGSDVTSIIIMKIELDIGGPYTVI